MKIKLTKREWYDAGGFRNSYLYRKQSKNSGWSYYASDIRFKEIAGKLKQCAMRDRNGDLCPMLHEPDSAYCKYHAYP